MPTSLYHRCSPLWVTPHHGKTTIDTLLRRQLKAYTKEDTPSVCVKLIPISILHKASALALQAGDDTSLALLDLLWLAFFFLLRPGEYLQPSSTSHPFRICDIRLWCNSEHINVLSCALPQLMSATFVSLTLDTQKNDCLGEPMGHGRSGHPIACPVLAVARRLIYLRRHSTTDATPLCSLGPAFITIVPTPLTMLLPTAVTHSSPPLGIKPTDINEKSLCSTGAMSLLNQLVDSDRIRLLGRWQSDAMLSYLHVQAHNVKSGFSSIIMQGGDFTLIPSSSSTLATFR
jgi:hypothetical protein